MIAIPAVLLWLGSLSEITSAIPEYDSLAVMSGTLASVGNCSKGRHSSHLPVIVQGNQGLLSADLPCTHEVETLGSRLGEPIEIRTNIIHPYIFLATSPEVWSIRLSGKEIYSYEARADRTRSTRPLVWLGFLLMSAVMFFIISSEIGGITVKKPDIGPAEIIITPSLSSIIFNIVVSVLVLPILFIAILLAGLLFINPNSLFKTLVFILLSGGLAALLAVSVWFSIVDCLRCIKFRKMPLMVMDESCLRIRFPSLPDTVIIPFDQIDSIRCWGSRGGSRIVFEYNHKTETAVLPLSMAQLNGKSLDGDSGKLMKIFAARIPDMVVPPLGDWSNDLVKRRK